jgi:pimeloyl-ACP methyl ester carboxylesterase
VPTLVVHGTEDHIVPFALGRKMAERIPRARFVTVSGGHRALSPPTLTCSWRRSGVS